MPRPARVRKSGRRATADVAGAAAAVAADATASGAKLAPTSRRDEGGRDAALVVSRASPEVGVDQSWFEAGADKLVFARYRRVDGGGTSPHPEGWGCAFSVPEARTGPSRM